MSANRNKRSHIEFIKYMAKSSIELANAKSEIFVFRVIERSLTKESR